MTNPGAQRFLQAQPDDHYLFMLTQQRFSSKKDLYVYLDEYEVSVLYAKVS